MFNLGNFISENVTFRPKSMFLADGILMQLRCEIKSPPRLLQSATSFLYLQCEIKDAALPENLKVINVSEGMTDHFKQPLSEQYHQFIVE